jgi:hypothetical protein
MQPIALAEDERRTLASLAVHALEPAGERLLLAARRGGSEAGTAACVREVVAEAQVIARIFEAAHDGVIDVGDPVIRRWLGERRDVLLSLLREDRAALRRAVGKGEDVAITARRRWQVVDADLDELALVARLLSDALGRS